MSYETAPATLVLATHCVVCGRPLVDAKSVEVGMGPECRRRYGCDDVHDVTEAQRKEANVATYRLALWRKELLGAPTSKEAASLVARVRELGFVTLSSTLAQRLCDVALEVVEDRGSRALALSTPYDERFVAELKRRAPVRRWDASTSRWLLAGDMTSAEKDVVWSLARERFGGRLFLGPDGRVSHIPTLTSVEKSSAERSTTSHL
jgi:hypothetical protein